MNHLKLI